MKKNIRLSIYGATIGDYYGSYWEFLTNKPDNSKDALKIRVGRHWYTDDTFMTCAIAKALMVDGDLAENAVKEMRRIGNGYPSSYGGSFSAWLRSMNPQPYDSWGNGASMRVSPAPLKAKTEGEAVLFCNEVTKVTHNHPYAIYWAEMVSRIIFKAKECNDMLYMAEYVMKMDNTGMVLKLMEQGLGYLIDNYQFTESSQDTVPQAIYCFLSSSSFADCLARALRIGGDSDTLAAIACSMAAPFYGDEQVFPFLKKLPRLPKELDDILKVFSATYLC